MAAAADGGGRRSRHHRNRLERTQSMATGMATRTSGHLARSWAGGSVVIIAVVVVALLYQHLSTSPETRLSVILRSQLTPVWQAIDHRNQLDAYLLHDPLASVLKSKLRPVQERIASLKTQTGQYERMERIPGGPTQFIDSSLKEIQGSILDRVWELDKERNTILKAYMDGALALAKTSTQNVKSSALRLNDDHLRLLMLDGIYFVPIPTEAGGLPPQELERLKQQTSLEQLAELVEELAILYEPLEATVQELEQVGQANSGLNTLTEILRSLDSLPDDVYARLEPGLLRREENLKQLAEFKTKYGNQLQLFYGFQGEHVRQLNEATAKAQDAGPNRRKPYLALYQSILDEIRNLQTRIGNLKYKYVKLKG